MSSIPIKKNKTPLKAGATGKSTNPKTLQRVKALQGISGAEAELVRARSNLRTQISQQKKKAIQTDEYAQLPDDQKESWLNDYVAAKTKRAVARVTEAVQDADKERAHLKRIQEEEKSAAELTMTFDELMADLGETMDSVCGSVDGISSDDETTSNCRACSLEDGGNAEGRDGDCGEEHVKLSKEAIIQRDHFLWLYQWIEQVSRPGYREAERYFNERDALDEAEKAKAKTGEAAEAAATGEATKATTGEATRKAADKRKLSSGTAGPRKRRVSSKQERGLAEAEKQKGNVYHLSPCTGIAELIDVFKVAKMAKEGSAQTSKKA